MEVMDFRFARTLRNQATILAQLHSVTKLFVDESAQSDGEILAEINQYLFADPDTTTSSTSTALAGNTNAKKKKNRKKKKKKKKQQPAEPTDADCQPTEPEPEAPAIVDYQASEIEASETEDYQEIDI